MSALPILRGTSQALYPFTQTFEYLTVVVESQNGKQQRMARRPAPLVSTEIRYGQLSRSLKNTLKTAYIAAEGQQNTTLSITIGAVTYSDLSFDSDLFAATEKEPTQYDADIKLVQSVAQSGLTASGTPGTFPAFSYGATTQLPFTEAQRMRTDVGVSPVSGTRFTYAWNTSSGRGVNFAGLRTCTLSFPLMSDADVAILSAHFVANRGRYGKFSFTNPDDAVAYASCHYASDSLTISYAAPNRASVTFQIEETNN